MGTMTPDYRKSSPRNYGAVARTSQGLAGHVLLPGILPPTQVRVGRRRALMAEQTAYRQQVNFTLEETTRRLASQVVQRQTFNAGARHGEDQALSRPPVFNRHCRVCK